MLVNEEPNPYFDAKKMIRKGCKYVDTTPELMETTKILMEEPTLTEDEVTETKTTTLKEETILMEDVVTETTIRDDLKEKFAPTPIPPVQQNPVQLMGSLSEGEIRINKEIFIPKYDPSEPNINLKRTF
ncbi:UNVERIFIED_CONTAM: hypothetical protein RMT77_017868 [Armadillidium vulgare]